MSFTFTATFETSSELVAFLMATETPATAKVTASNALTEGDAAADLAGTPRPSKAEVKTAPKPKAAAAASAEPAQSPAPAPAADAKASAEPEAPKVKAVDYPTLQKKVFELAAAVQKKGIDTAEWVVSIAKKHGGDNFKALKPESYAAALDDVTKQIAKVAALEEAVA